MTVEATTAVEAIETLKKHIFERVAFRQDFKTNEAFIYLDGLSSAPGAFRIDADELIAFIRSEKRVFTYTIK